MHADKDMNLPAEMLADPKDMVVHAPSPLAVAPPLLQYPHDRTLSLSITNTAFSSSAAAALLKTPTGRQKKLVSHLVQYQPGPWKSREYKKEPTFGRQRLVHHGLFIQPGRAAGTVEEAVGVAEATAIRRPERGEDPRLGGLPGGGASGAAAGGGGGGGGDGDGDDAELPGAAAQAEHFHPGLHDSPGSKN